MNKILVILYCLLCPLLAIADSSSLSFTPPATDYSVAFLANLFGVVDGVLHGTGSQIMGNIFSVFNAAVLALGGIVIMYTLLVGTMNTAHEGKMLGQKWSSVWIPVRSTIGLTLLIPKASGYCLMQIFVMWVVVQGIGAADKVWESALDYLNRGGVIIQATMSPVTSTAADNSLIAKGGLAIFASTVCMLGLQKQLEATRQNYLDLKNSSSPSGPCAGEPSDTMKTFCTTSVPDFLSTIDAVNYQRNNINQTKNFTIDMPYFDNNSMYMAINGICGTMSWSPLPESMTASLEANVNTLSSADVDTVKLSRATAVQQMYIDYSSVAKTIVDNDPKIKATTDATSKPAYPNVANSVFGVPYPASGNAPCVTKNEVCVLWGGAPGEDGVMSAPLFNGAEFQGGIADYNGVMMPTVQLLEDLKDKDQMNDARNFIVNAKAQGWLTAGSYFFDLVYLNGSATKAAGQTDTLTGLDASVTTPDDLLSPFINSGTCNNSDRYALLCTIMNGDSTRIRDVVRLIHNDNYPLPNVNMTGDAKTTSGQAASTVYGFVTNSLIFQPPGGQPGLQAPEFGMNFNFKLEEGLFHLPNMRFDCGDILGTCVGRILGNIFYNGFIKPLFSFFLDTLAQIENMVIMACISVPLALMSQIFINGVAYIQDPGVNPIVALANMGTAYINLSATLWLSLINLTAATFGLAIPLLAISSPLIIAWVGVMVGIGFSTAYYLPFLPYMIFTFGVIAWMMAVIEAMVAAPIVALGVTHPEGEGILGKGEQALMILMNIFLRPTMMIIGYIAAIALCYISVWIINSGFSHVLQFIQGDHEVHQVWKGGSGYTNWAGIYGLFFSVVIYTMMYLTVAQKAFNLIYLLPDHVLRWIGGHAETVGQETSQWGEEAKGQVKEAGTKSLDAQAQIAKKATGAAVMAASAAATAAGGPAAGMAVNAVGKEAASSATGEDSE